MRLQILYKRNHPDQPLFKKFRECFCTHQSLRRQNNLRYVLTAIGALDALRVGRSVQSGSEDSLGDPEALVLYEERLQVRVSGTADVEVALDLSLRTLVRSQLCSLWI